MEFLLSFDLGHGEGLLGGDGDDLVVVVVSGDWDDLPLLLLMSWLVHLGDDFAASVVSDDLDLVSLLLVEGKTVVPVVGTALGDEDLVPLLGAVLIVSNNGSLLSPAVHWLATSAVIEDLLELDVLDLDLGGAAEDGLSAGGLLGSLDATLLNVVPELALGTFLLAPSALVGLAVKVLLAVAWVSGLVVDILLVALRVGGWVLLLVVGGASG